MQQLLTFISKLNAYLMSGFPIVSPQLYGYRGKLINRSSLWINWIYTDRTVHASCCQAHSMRMECQTTNRTNPWPHETFMIFYCVKSWSFHIVHTYVLVHRATGKTDHQHHQHELGCKAKMSLCLTKHHAMKTYWGSRGKAPCILNLSTRWKSEVNLMLWPLYPRSKSHLVPNE